MHRTISHLKHLRPRCTEKFSRSFSTKPSNESVAALQQDMERLLEHAEHPNPEENASLQKDGTAITTKGQLVTIGGLSEAKAGTVAQFESGASAFIFDLRASEINAAVIDHPSLSTSTVQTGDKIINYTPKSVTFPVGPATKGRVLDSMGNPLDGLGPLKDVEYRRSLVARVPGIASRGKTNDPFVTGIKKIDLLSPIGKGQRVALVGVPGTGKTTTALNMLIHHAQSDPNAHCVYAAVGTPHGFHAIVDLLKEEDVLQQFTLVCADRNDSEASKYLAPYGACAVAEWFQKKGHHAAVVYDDLVSHATSLVNLGQLTNMALSERTRYLHANLLERAAQMSPAQQGGSMTAIALVDTPHTDRHHADQFAADETYQLGQRTGTTVSSIVDLTLTFDAALSADHKWPAIDVSGDAAGRPTLASQPKPLAELSQGLYHMQVAARETSQQMETMGEFGLNLYDEGRIEEGKRMKYWGKMEEMLLTGDALSLALDESDREWNGTDDEFAHLPPVRLGGATGFPNMGRARSSELYVTLVAGALGHLNHVPLQYVQEYERFMWKAARLEEEGKMMAGLDECMDKNEVVAPAVAEQIKRFVGAFTRDYVASLGVHAVGESLVPAELGGRHQSAT